MTKGMKSGKITALVVDDSIINQTVHRRLLNSLGIDNQVVGNGKEAIDVHCTGECFDLILMDLDMPIMNGIEATRRLREMGITCAIVGVSTRDVEEEKREFINAGLDEYLEKPLTISKFLPILQKMNLA